MNLYKAVIAVSSVLVSCHTLIADTTTYRVNNSDMTVRVPDGDTFNVELYMVEDDGGSVERVYFHGTAMTESGETYSVTGDINENYFSNTLNDLTFDNQRDPLPSATDGSGKRYTRLSYEHNTHEVDLEYVGNIFKIIVDPGFDDALANNGFIEEADGDTAAGIPLILAGYFNRLAECRDQAHLSCDQQCGGETVNCVLWVNYEEEVNDNGDIVSQKCEWQCKEDCCE